jgi:hypothetical protein
LFAGLISANFYFGFLPECGFLEGQSEVGAGIAALLRAAAAAPASTGVDAEKVAE